MYISLIFITLVFGFILLNILNNKKISIFSFLCFIVMIFYFISYYTKNKYYIELQTRFNSIDLYYKIFCVSSLIISFIELLIGYKMQVNINKQTILNDEKKVNINNDNMKNDINIFLEMINEPIAFYFNNEYIINTKLKKLLKLDKYIITEDTFFTLINTDDLNTYKNNTKQSIFRFKFDNEKWFEEVTVNIDSQKYKMIRLGNKTNKKINIYTYNDLINIVKVNNNERKEYSLLFIDINNAKDIKSVYGKDLLDLVINKYLNDISELSFLFDLKIYYISYKEYVILIEDKNQYDIIISSFQDDSSVILKDEIKISNNIINLNCKVGIVSTTELTDRSLIITKGYDILKLACSSDYPGDYAIYNEIDEEISFNDLDINFNLEKYKQRLQ